MAELLEQAGQEEEAQRKRAEARATIEEIADLLQDETLHAAYVSNTLEKIAP
jgi:hypothetical protein